MEAISEAVNYNEAKVTGVIPLRISIINLKKEFRKYPKRAIAKVIGTYLIWKKLVMDHLKYTPQTALVPPLRKSIVWYWGQVLFQVGQQEEKPLNDKGADS